MKILENKKELADLLDKIKALGLKIALIPTMGSIHQGHLSLVERAKKENFFSVVSIYINPTQFNNLEDFKKYPQNKETDINILRKVGCDVLYLPSTNELYPLGIKRKKTVFHYRKILCDKFRPGHFDGVTTIVKTLFDHVQPNTAYFGEKDFQQLKLIEKMIKTLNIKITIQACSTVRLKNGMSISSRYNKFSLKEKEIFNQIAINIRTCVKSLRKKIQSSYIIKLKEELFNKNIDKIDYIEIRDEDNLELTNEKNKSRLFIAFYIGNIRIIDNFILY